MSAARPLAVPPDPDWTDHFVYLQGRWEDYERLLAMRGESSVPWITYLEGLIELRSPSQYHEGERDRPDIAIEVIWTSGGIDKLEVYRKLGVREVWYYEFLPQLPLELLLAGMQDATQSQTAAVRTLRQALRARAE
jgi:hypothetical protein